jgi:hypothetical protein
MPTLTAPQASPNVLNYFIGKGNVYAKLIDDPDDNYVHMGNCPKFEISPKPEVKKHYDSMEGTKELDFIGIVSKEGEVTIDLDEITPDNLMIAVLGEVESDGSIEILKAAKIERAIKLVGTNDIGAKVEVTLPRVFFDGNKAINLIDDNFGSVPLSGQILKKAGSFGNIKFL